MGSRFISRCMSLMKEIKAAAEDVRFMVVFDTEPLPGMHAPKAVFQLLENIRLHEFHVESATLHATAW